MYKYLLTFVFDTKLLGFLKIDLLHFLLKLKNVNIYFRNNIYLTFKVFIHI